LWRPLVIVEVSRSVRCEFEELIRVPLWDLREDQRYSFAGRPTGAADDGASAREIVVFVRFDRRKTVEFRCRGLASGQQQQAVRREWRSRGARPRGCRRSGSNEGGIPGLVQFSRCRASSNHEDGGIVRQEERGMTASGRKHVGGGGKFRGSRCR